MKQGRKYFFRTLSLLSMCVTLLAGVAVRAAPAKPPATSFPPLETCNRLPGATQFRAALAQAVSTRNVTAFVALTAPNVRLDFGEGVGRAELRRRLTGTEGRKLWTELDRIMPLGCAVQERNLVMPSIFAHDFGDTDAFDVMVVTGSQVPLRDGPSATAKPLRLLSWSLVEPLSGDDFEKPFRRVKVHGGGPTGYIDTPHLRSLLDYRLVVSRRGRAWQIDAFVAGD